MAAHMEKLCLIDADDNKDYYIIVSQEDAKKARTDITFATVLLQEAKKRDTVQSISCNISQDINEPSTSKTSTCTNNMTNENAENTHIWSKEETLLLLNTYDELKHDLHNGKGTVKKFWVNIANILQDKGYDVTGVKCSTKFQALKRTYKNIVDHNSQSGNNTKQWEY